MDQYLQRRRPGRHPWTAGSFFVSTSRPGFYQKDLARRGSNEYAYANGNARRILVRDVTLVSAWVLMGFAGFRSGGQPVKHSIAAELRATGQEYALRVLRPTEGVDYHVKTLSVAYGGLYIHYKPKKSVYCRGTECDSATHKIPRQFKGYFSAEVYDPDLRVWLATVFELTQNAERDVRGRYARGQVWRFFRPPQINGLNQPLAGDLLEQLDPHQVSREFPILPTLQCMYNCSDIDLSAKNWMQPKTVVEQIKAPPPAALAKVSEDRPATAEELEAAQAKAAENGNRFMADFLNRKKKQREANGTH